MRAKPIQGVAPAPAKARLVRRTEVHRSSIGAFAVHELELTTGSSFRLAMIEHPGASAVVPVLSDGRIVMIRQYRYAAGGDIWEVPAGKLDAGEAPAVCAARELEEETGYRAGRIVASGRILTTPGFSDEVIHLFCAFDLVAGATRLEPNELIERRELRLEEALEMIERGDIVDAKTIVALYHAQRLLRDASAPAAAREIS